MLPKDTQLPATINQVSSQLAELSYVTENPDMQYNQARLRELFLQRIQRLVNSGIQYSTLQELNPNELGTLCNATEEVEQLAKTLRSFGNLPQIRTVLFTLFNTQDTPNTQ
jgi:uncharacterized membrane protein YccC